MQLRPYQNDLVSTVKQSYRDGFKSPCIVLGCGGGKSIIVGDMAKRTTDNGKRVLFLVHRKELCEQIEKTFIACGVNMNLCQIGMVQTITRRLPKTKKPALIITDENHHCLAKSYKDIYEYFSDACRVGVTATPIRMNGGGLGDINDKLIVGVSTEWLIHNQFLAPYDYYAPKLIDTDSLHTKKGDYAVSEIELKPAIYGDVIGYYRKLSDQKQAICYCATIAHSKEMARQFNAAGISAEHIDGKTPKINRADIISKFRSGETTILCNVDLISEGFDVPDCNTAILLRPTKSLTLYIQQSMRCMRYMPGKRAVIIDHVGNYTRFGLPDDNREWSLEPKRPGNNTQIQVQIKECPECFRVFPPALKCPYCGCEFDKPDRSLKEIKTVALEKITKIKMDYTTRADCQTMSEFVDFGKRHGYKPGWAYFQAKSKGVI